MKKLLALALTVLVSGCVAHAQLASASRRSGPFERVTLAWNDPPAPDPLGRAEPSTLTTAAMRARHSGFTLQVIVMKRQA